MVQLPHHHEQAHSSGYWILDIPVDTGRDEQNRIE